MSVPPPPTTPYTPIHSNLLQEWQTWVLNPSSSFPFSFTDEEVKTHSGLVSNLFLLVLAQGPDGATKAREQLAASMASWKERKDVAAQQVIGKWRDMGQKQLAALEKAEKRVAELESKINYIRDKLYEGEGNGAAAPSKQSSA